MTEKKATLTATIYDLLNVPMSSNEIVSYNLPPNGTILYLTCFLSIPDWASIGDAIVSACAYTAPASLGGVPYSPEVSRHFLIVYRDVAVLSVEISPTVVYKGEPVNIDVTVMKDKKLSHSTLACIITKQISLIQSTLPA